MSAGPISEAFVAILPAIDTAAFSAEVESGVESAVARVGSKAFAPLEVQASKAGQRAGAALDESFSKASTSLTSSAAKTGEKAGAALDASFGKAVAPLSKEADAAADKAGAVGTEAGKGGKSGLIGLAALAGGYELVKHSIDDAQQRQLDIIRSTNVFSKQALPAVTAAVDDVSKKTFQTIETTRESINSLGTALQSVGVTQKQSIGLSAALVQRIGDVSAKTGTDVGTLIQSVQTSIASGSTRALKSLNVVADTTDISFEAAKKGIVQLVGTNKDLATAQGGLVKLQQQLTDAQDQYGKGSKQAAAVQTKIAYQQTVVGNLQKSNGATQKQQLSSLLSLQGKVTAAQDAYKAAVDKFGPSSAQAASAQKKYNGLNADFLTQVKAQVPSLTKQQKALAVTQLILDKTTGSQGAAEAKSKTFAGSLQTLKVAFENLEEEIGAKLIPVLTKVANATSSFIGFLEKHKTTAKIITDTFAALAAALLVYKVAVTTATAVTTAFTAVQDLLDGSLDANPIGILVIGITALIVALVEAYKHSETFRDIVNKIGSVLKTVLGPVLQFVEGHLKLVALGFAILVGPITATIALFVLFHKRILAIILDVYNFIKAHWELIIEILLTLLGPIGVVVAVFLKFHDQIIAFLTAVVTAVISFVGSVVSFFASLPGKIGAALSSLATVVGNIFDHVEALVLNVIQHAFNLWLDVYVKFPEAVAKALAGLASTVAGIFTSVGSRALSAVQSSVSRIVSAFAALPGKIIGLGGRLLSAGKSFIGKLFDGIKAGLSGAGGFVENIGSDIKNAINGALNLPLKIPKVSIGAFGKHVSVGGETLIPRLAKGGVFDKATLAVIGEAGKEVAIPLTNPKRALQLAHQSGLLDLLTSEANRQSRASLAAVTSGSATSTTATRTTTNHNTFVLPAADPSQHAQMVGHRLATWSDR